MTPTSSATSPRAELLGPAFAHALARGDFAQVAEVLCPDVEFRALTPRRPWEAQTAEETLAILQTWFNPTRVVDDVLGIRSDIVGDRHSVTYRFSGEEPQERFVIEQYAYYTERDGRIGWMRVVCSGFRPAG
jgi:ketosteroid isomerase-like protein